MRPIGCQAAAVAPVPSRSADQVRTAPRIGKADPGAGICRTFQSIGRDRRISRAAHHGLQKFRTQTPKQAGGGRIAAVVEAAASWQGRLAHEIEVARGRQWLADVRAVAILVAGAGRQPLLGDAPAAADPVMRQPADRHRRMRRPAPGRRLRRRARRTPRSRRSRVPERKPAGRCSRRSDRRTRKPPHRSANTAAGNFPHPCCTARRRHRIPSRRDKATRRPLLAAHRRSTRAGSRNPTPSRNFEPRPFL